MNSQELYKHLEKDFIKTGLSDDWAKHMQGIEEFITENFKKRSMGLVCDNAEEIKKVYTAAFPTDKVMKQILDKNETNILLFVHHPSTWNNAKNTPSPWQEMNKVLLEQFRKKSISIYNLHVPLDNYSKYSTSFTLAQSLGIKPIKKIVPYRGGMTGLIGKTRLRTVKELSRKFTQILCHKTSLYNYGDSEIKNGIVAVVAGGGNEPEILQELIDNQVYTLITGISRIGDYPPAIQAHKIAKQHRINILGGTHYSTEKFACQAMCKYFEKLNIPSEFIDGEPIIEDL